MAFARPQAEKAPSSPASNEKGDGRKRIYRAIQVVEVEDVDESERQIEARVQALDGYVESSSARRNGDSDSSLVLRVPTDELRPLLEEIAAQGKETYRRIEVEDTTVAFVDLEARLRNTEALQLRLRSLLAAAESVSDVLEIEKELARVQSELDAMKARFQLMQSQVRLAKVDLTLEAHHLPGPLGAAGKGLWWTLRRLFVLK